MKYKKGFSLNPKAWKIALFSALAGASIGFPAGYGLRGPDMNAIYVQPGRVEFYSRRCDGMYNYMIYQERKSSFETPLSEDEALKKFAQEKKIDRQFMDPIFYCEPEEIKIKKPPVA